MTACFYEVIRAVYTSSRILAAQGRLSFRASLESHQLPVQIIEVNNGHARDWQWNSTPVTEKVRPGSAPLTPFARPSETVVGQAASDNTRTGSRMGSAIGSLRDIGQRITRRVVSAIILPSNPLAFLKPRVVLFREVMRDEVCRQTRHP